MKTRELRSIACRGLLQCGEHRGGIEVELDANGLAGADRPDVHRAEIDLPSAQPDKYAEELASIVAASF